MPPRLFCSRKRAWYTGRRTSRAEGKRGNARSCNRLHRSPLLPPRRHWLPAPCRAAYRGRSRNGSIPLLIVGRRSTGLPWQLRGRVPVRRRAAHRHERADPAALAPVAGDGAHLASGRGAFLAVNYALDGLNVRGYHAFNLAVHLLAALVLFASCDARWKAPSCGTAIVARPPGWQGRRHCLGSVHPLQTESMHRTSISAPNR